MTKNFHAHIYQGTNSQIPVTKFTGKLTGSIENVVLHYKENMCMSFSVKEIFIPIDSTNEINKIILSRVGRGNLSVNL